MKHQMTRLSVFALLALGLAFAGCADDSSNPVGGAEDDISGTETLDSLNLDEDFGGLAYTDEPEGFGDDELLAAMMIDEQASLSEDEEDSLLDEADDLDPRTLRRTFVKILWGQLEGDFDGTREDFEAIDWSGSVKVTDGVVALKRTILFERPTDRRLPRVSRDSLAWVSKTYPHYDGIVISILSPELDGVAQGDLIIDMPLFQATLSIDGLDGYEQLTRVDEDGNSVSIRGEIFETAGCAKGFLMGFWKNIADLDATEAIEMGVFKGRYVGQNGITTGFIRGMFGLDSEGQPVLFGKYVNRNGRVQGLIAGTWEADGDGEGMGSFRARWVNRRGARMGTLGGMYHENGRNEIGDGFFEGRYQENCGSGS